MGRTDKRYWRKSSSPEVVFHKRRRHKWRQDPTSPINQIAKGQTPPSDLDPNETPLANSSIFSSVDEHDYQDMAMIRSQSYSTVTPLDQNILDSEPDGTDVSHQDPIIHDEIIVQPLMHHSDNFAQANQISVTLPKSSSNDSIIPPKTPTGVRYSTTNPAFSGLSLSQILTSSSDFSIDDIDVSDYIPSDKTGELYEVHSSPPQRNRVPSKHISRNQNIPKSIRVPDSSQVIQGQPTDDLLLASQILTSDFDPMIENDSNGGGASNHMVSGTRSISTTCKLPPSEVVTIEDFGLLVKQVESGEITARSLLHRPLQIDWERSVDFANDSSDFTWSVLHFWDYICFEGKPFRALGNSKGILFQSVRFSFARWTLPYGNNRYGDNHIKDNWRHYFLHIGTTQRLQWYLVLKQNMESGDGNDLDSKEGRLPQHRFTELLSLILYVFETSPELFKYGINEHTFSANLSRHWDIDMIHWNYFQQMMFEKWEQYFRKMNSWSYWQRFVIVMHAFDFGGNDGISLSEDKDEEQDVDYIATSLSNLFDFENVDSVSFALASEVEVVNNNEDGSSTKIGLIGDIPQINAAYTGRGSSNGLRVFPLGFSPVAGNFQSSSAPELYRKHFLPVQKRNSELNMSAEDDLLEIASFQGYSTLKQQFHPTKSLFAIGQSTYVGAYCVPDTHLTMNQKAKYDRLLREAKSHMPFNQIKRGVEISKHNDSVGYRFEPVIKIKWDQLDRDNQNPQYLAREIVLPLLRIWETNGVALSRSLLRGYGYEEFPMILHKMCTVFQIALQELVNETPSLASIQYLVKTEAIAMIERLSYELATGDRSKRSSRLWRIFNLMQSLNERSWPYIDPDVFNLFDLSVQVELWPRNVEFVPYFTQIPSIRYHYGQHIANRQCLLLSSLLAQFTFKSPYKGALEGTAHIINTAYISEMVRFFLNGLSILKMRISKSEMSQAINPLSSESQVSVMAQLIERWEGQKEPLSNRAMGPVLKAYEGFVEVDNIYPDDYAKALFMELIRDDNRTDRANCYCTSWMSWFGYLKNLIGVIGHGENSAMSQISWEYAIVQGLRQANIEYVPGENRKRPSYTRVLRIRYDLGSRSVQQRKALMMQYHHRQDCLGFTLPLTRIPRNVEKLIEAFFARTPTKNSSTAERNGIVERQNLVRRLLAHINIDRSFDQLLLIYSALLTVRSPLPFCEPESRTKQWENLKCGKQTTDHYATGFLCVAMYYRYSELQKGESNEMSWDIFRRKLEPLKITTGLYEKLGLFVRVGGFGRGSAKWNEMRSASALDLEFKRRCLNDLFRTKGPEGLLSSIYEDDDVQMILANLV